ncbi:MAG: hypothetical protein EON58_03400 [Alphaproteobacteria bacterium]|nr:MAG: hypothetical protein EON58_03400 [Alphaproteobacteria bacterium]
MADPLMKFRTSVPDFEGGMASLLAAPAVPLGAADPPCTTGVYALVHEGQIKYIGEAIGSKGLRDRLLSKHLSGDDGHTLQRVFAAEFPERLLRREHIKNYVYAKWHCVPDRATASALERLLIWAMRPEWNRK